jgi:hypothetical protein
MKRLSFDIDICTVDKGIDLDSFDGFATTTLIETRSERSRTNNNQQERSKGKEIEYHAVHCFDRQKERGSREMTIR